MLRRVGKTDFNGVGFTGFRETPADKAAVGLKAAGVHVGIDALEADLDGVAETCAALDCDRIVVLYLDNSHFENAAVIRETSTWLSALADRLADRGLALDYHNHDHAFVDLAGDERSAFDLLIDETDDALSIELDIDWATAAGTIRSRCSSDSRGAFRWSTSRTWPTADRSNSAPARSMSDGRARRRRRVAAL